MTYLVLPLYADRGSFENLAFAIPLDEILMEQLQAWVEMLKEISVFATLQMPDKRVIIAGNDPGEMHWYLSDLVTPLEGYPMPWLIVRGSGYVMWRLYINDDDCYSESIYFEEICNQMKRKQKAFELQVEEV